MASYSPDDGLLVSLGMTLSSSALLSWLTTKNDRKTITAPSQYTGDAYWDCRNISPTKDSGIVRLRPTVTTRGVVRSIAYAHAISEMNDESELTLRKR